MLIMHSFLYFCICLSCVVLCQAYSGSGQSDDLILQLLARVDSLEKQGQKQNEIISILQEDLRQQAMKDEQQTATIDKQQQQLNQQTVFLTKQQTQLEEQRSRLWQQEILVKQLKNTVQQQKTKESVILKDSINTEQNSPLPHLKHLLKYQERNLTKADHPKVGLQQKRLLVDPEGPVAFQARIDTHEISHIGINQNIVFDVVEMNLGGGYHNQHGIFIAPQPGIYIFSTSLLSGNHGSGEAFAVYLVKNGAVLGKAAGYYQNWGNDEGSVTVVTQLKTGDEVWVKLSWPENANLRGDGYTSFMGCLVMPM